MGIRRATLLLVCFAILLFGSSIFETEAIAAKQILFEDNFESYSTGTFPSSAWQLWFDGMGSENQTVGNFFNDSQAKSLQLLGVSGWSAVAAHAFVSDSPIIGFNVSVRVEQNGGRARDTARVSFAELSSSIVSTDYAPIWFTDSGAIGTMNKALQSYVPGRWYRIMSIIDRSKETYSVWIDDVLVGENMTVKTNRGELEAGETSWNIKALELSQNYYNTSAYFDDVTVFSVFDLDPKLDLEPSLGFSSTLVGSGFAPRSMIVVTWNGTEMNTVPSPLVTSAYGNFTALISALDQTHAGVYVVKVVDGMGNDATANFEVVPEGLTIGVMVLASSVAVIVSSRYFRKQPKNKN